MTKLRLIVVLACLAAVFVLARAAAARCLVSAECEPGPRPSVTAAGMVRAPASATPDPRECNPDTGWWDKPVVPEYAIAVVLDHEVLHQYDYCPPAGSEWERWATTPGYFLTQTPAPGP